VVVAIQGLFSIRKAFGGKKKEKIMSKGSSRMGETKGEV